MVSQLESVKIRLHGPRSVGAPVPAGLLYYSQLDSTLRVEPKINEIRALLMARNELADHLSKKRKVSDASPILSQQEANLEDTPFLPPTIDHPRECRQCYAVDSCMLYRKVSTDSVSSRRLD